MPSTNMRSIDAGRFAMVPRADVPRSVFETPHYHKTTFSAAGLYPIFVEEILPGDSVTVRMHAFIRLATPIVPVMDNLRLESFFFFVPNRLVWSNWERFMGEKLNPTDVTSFLVPTVPVTVAAAPIFSIYDYFGIQVNGAGSLNVSALPFRGYNLIWNEFFRDQDLQVPVVVDVDDGPDATGDYNVLQAGKRHDYFTSARPWPQKPANTTAWTTLGGANAPGGPFSWSTMPITSQGAAPVTGIGYVSAQTTSVGPTAVKTPGGRNLNYSPDFGAATPRIQASGTDGWPDVKVLVNDIRTATLIQQMLERDSRGGTRYTERVRAHFGVLSPDARLQRPEYLGGGRSMVTIHPLAQTSATGITGGTTVLGQQSGIGTIQVYNHGFSGSFTEHGYIIGVITVRADLAYQNGVNRLWFRRTMFDFYWPGLNGLGEQAVQERELFASGTAADGNVFGYQERWAEYKYKPSRTSAEFRSSGVAPLDMWHFAENFAAAPVLNAAFVIDPSATTVNRVLQSSSFNNQQFLGDFLFEERIARAMPMFSIPGMGARL